MVPWRMVLLVLLLSQRASPRNATPCSHFIVITLVTVMTLVIITIIGNVYVHFTCNLIVTLFFQQSQGLTAIWYNI
jgi:hypothetical protein